MIQDATAPRRALLEALGFRLELGDLAQDRN